ncbi:polyamine (spermidine/putrescine) ABC transporter permease [Mycoplasmopsis californica]|uniref:ABC transporter permease n=1 Tax=Mycoplasmopsis equigenitalium TaxID=114883 RepID=A0ABY5J1Y3_9BACT|nr:ABC transporter permease [Mycoplasmopsis equigenitalium]UUD36729.1 ABC transporter permease [Mycoplasmopsis equigenitalium]VEU69977.1 polyamine (spermidine/putrescine) ABC transporter permease [Mycoplasmopsis californica]
MQKIKNWLALNPRLALLVPYFVIAILLIILPVILIIISAFTYHGEDLDNWKVIKTSSFGLIVWRSIKLGVIAAFVSLLIAMPYAFFVAMHRSKTFKIFSLTLIISPLLIFSIAKVYAVRGVFLSVFEEDSLNAEWFMVVGMVYLNLPFMIMPLYGVFKDMPRNILEASQDLGYSKWQTFFKVIIPYSLKAIISGLVLVFISSSTSIIISDKLLPNGDQFQTIGNQINDYANPGSPTSMSISSTIVIVVTIVIFSVSALFYLVPKIIAKIKRVNYE